MAVWQMGSSWKDYAQEFKMGGRTRFVGGTCPMTNPLPLPVLLLLQVMIGEVEVRQCAAHYLMLPGRRRVVPEAPGSGQLCCLFSMDYQRRITVGLAALLAYAALRA
jgi:hypothetical protein